MNDKLLYTGKQLVENRQQIKEILQREQYGFIPPPPSSISVEIIHKDERFCAGKSVLWDMVLTAKTANGDVVFPFKLCLPTNGNKHKVVVYINFSGDVPSKCLPAEEVIDLGWGFANLFYKDITSDDGDFTDKNASILRGKGECASGKIAMWAWCAMRLLDYLLTRNDVDCKNVAVAGHSRLGKTALVASAFDERFAFCHSNDSGAGGSAFYQSIYPDGEHIADLVKVFPYWFCPNFANHVGKEQQLPFDQHYLMSLLAPRVLSVSSAIGDPWASPKAERLSAEMATPAWEYLGFQGLSKGDWVVDQTYHQGKVGYYVRSGMHYMSRVDWQNMLAFFDKNLN